MRSLVVVVLLASPALVACAGADHDVLRPSASKVLVQHGRIDHVADGDTVTVNLSTGVQRRVRLVGIDTPEVYGEQECGGAQASALMKRLLPAGTRVRLRSDPTQAAVDRYGRLLRYLTTADSGLDVGKVELRKGWARVYVYHGVPFQRVKDYRKAAHRSRHHHRGVWAAC